MRDRFQSIFFLVILGLVAVYALGRPGGVPALAGAKAETALDRVLRTNTLRCGYYVFPPIFMRDPNTKATSGLAVDLMNILGAKTGLKIEWTEEVTFGNWIPALQARRFDAVCAPMWSDMAMGRVAAFTRPLFYAAIVPLVRANDRRFDGPRALEKLNDPKVTMLTQDGNSIQNLTQEVLPKAKQLTVPASVDGPTLLQNLLAGKADAALVDKNALLEFNRRNGPRLKALALREPVKAQSFVFPVERSETGLRDFLDHAVLELQLAGTMGRLLTRWEAEPGVFLRALPPYESARP